jgi:diadenosine tetraphosphate (Ap4A) HIT family hydrolase
LRNVVECGELWTLAINRNQNLLGKSVLVLNRHCERVTELSAGEWPDLHRCIARVTTALDVLYTPDSYTFAFPMNLDAYVYLHIVPRYASPREWQHRTYADLHHGSLFGTEEQPATEKTLAAIVSAMKGRL